MGKYDNMSYGQIKSQHDKLMKGKKARPDETKFKANERKMKETINGYKLKLAELKYEQEQIRSACDVSKKKQDALGENLKKHTDILKKRKADERMVTSSLSERLSESLGEKGLPKRISNPQQTYDDLQRQLSDEQGQLRSGNISMNEEKKSMRRIKLLQEKLETVKEYMDQNVDEVLQERDKAKIQVNEYRKTHEKAYQAFDKARNEASVQFNKLNENKDSQQKVRDQITQLQEKRGEAEQKYRKSWEDWENWNRDIRNLKTAMSAKEYEEEVISDNKKADKKVAEKLAADTKAKADAEAAKQKEAQERLESVDARRKAAVEEYERCQKELKRKAKVALPDDTNEVADVAVSSKKEDPHREEKELCQHLIAYCQSNMPSQDSSPSKGGKKKKKKKKKKIRLTHKPINFTNFAKVGVGIPIWSTDLEKCVQDLQDRIVSYDSEK